MLSRRSIFLASLFSAALLAPIGCAAPSSDEAEDVEVSETQDELTAAASQLAGKYYAHPALPGGFARLTLSADGTYTASVDVSLVAFCVTSPCVAPETGRWNAFEKPGGGFRLRVRPTGERARWYTATKAPSTLTLTRAGQTETLQAIDPGACLDDADCGTGEFCPKFCLMYCEVNDPFCCGVGSCQPSAPPPPPPPPPPSCWGAWLDQNGLCRTPADGVYPDECCAGPTCGNAQCAAGEVCCNPLLDLCTKPGEVCAF